MSAEHHVTVIMAERFLSGDSPADEAQFIEGHVEHCEECARALQREAAFEMSLNDVAAAPVPLRRRSIRTRVVLAVAATAALAAGTVLLVNSQQVRAEQHVPRLVRCDNPTTHADCVKAAHFDGLLTVGPTQQLEIPRYEEAPAGVKP